MKILELNKENFKHHISSSEKPILVDFWAPWCGPCRMLMPNLEQLASKKADEITVAKVNIDDNPEIATEFSVRSIPTLLIFKDGKIAATNVGGMSLKELEDWVKSSI